jgi:hypothetical protein
LLSQFQEGKSRYRLRRASFLARVGDHAGAAREAAELGQLDKPDPDLPYRLACIYTLCATAAQDDAKLAETYANSAMVHLRQAASEDFFRDADRAKSLAKDPDLNPLRAREDFRNLHLAEEPGYQLAYVAALAAVAVSHDAKLAEKHADRSMEHLRGLAAKGYFNDPVSFELLHKDKRLDHVRQRQDFQTLLKELEDKARLGRR